MAKFKPVAFKGTPAQLKARMCEKKVKYLTRALAESTFAPLEGAPPWRVYRCPHCCAWHRTTSKVKISRRKT
jgi:hypothetical protein